MRTASSQPPIEDYALIGDCGSAALVSKDGSIDWLCWPRFDSPSLFGALLDAEQGGSFRIHPAADYTAERRYLDATNILETTFRTEGGVLRLTDLMPVAEPETYRRELWPEHEVLRRIECVEGTVEVEVVCDPRPDYARTEPGLEDRGPLGFFYNHGSDVLVVRSEVPLELSKDGSTLSGTRTLHDGERCYVSLTYDQEEPAVLPLLGAHADERHDASAAYWRDWAGRCRYDGPYRAAVLRSILTVKLMTFAPSGAIIAAPTTSLPEVIGGEKNWDYRFCWLRDAGFTLRAAFELGYDAEGRAFLSWLLQATRRTFPRLNVLYNVYGNTDTDEKTLDHLKGYRNARPVRVGNGASEQFQLDIYGELVAAAFEYVQRGGSLDRSQRRMLRKLGDEVCDLWQGPDNGIWESRGERRHHTYSKAMCWVALDRLRQLAEHDVVNEPGGRWQESQDAIRKTVEERGFNEEMGSYTCTLDSRRVGIDASLLLLSIYGYADPAGERMKSTFAWIEKRLATGDLLYRHLTTDGDTPDEGAFGICGFWAVEHLALAGQVKEAHRRFEALLRYANDVGLFAEEIDPETGAARGNFPQAFTHVGLINAALTLASATEEETAPSLGERLPSSDSS